MRITGYEYGLHEAERDVVTYHWHPVGLSPVRYPHLHIGGRTSPTDLSKVHLVTGRVGLVEVVRMAITELGVEPLRRDWEDVLDRAERDLSSA